MEPGLGNRDKKRHMRTGFGYDIHRLTRGRPMVIGGVRIECEKGLEGHSDGDVLLHAVADAILGAVSGGDIGEKFPDTDAEFKDISSSIILKKAFDIMRQAGFRIGNIDCVVVAESPKIADHRQKIKESISSILLISPENVSVKGKTREKLGAVGRGEAIEAYASVLVVAGTDPA
jgi:2-C-methyl-D-erythritol 2,4-cyclodiphosphate synthase